MKYKAMILDVDGTLIISKRDAMPSAKVTETINKVSSMIHIGVATSRPLFLMSHIFDHLQLNGPSILCGGSQIIDVQARKILWEKRVDESDLEKLYAILGKHTNEFYVNDGDREVVYKKTAQFGQPLQLYSPALDIEKADILRGELAQIPAIAAYLVPAWVKGKIDLIITHAQATKQHGILEVAKILGINTREIIGIGDGYNDFPLLMACGLKVAMGNAVADLKAIADYIAPPVEEDGVAHVIEKFILNNDKHTKSIS